MYDQTDRESLYAVEGWLVVRFAPQTTSLRASAFAGLGRVWSVMLLALQEARAYVGERPPALILVANKSDRERYYRGTSGYCRVRAGRARDISRAAART